ncbi:MAG: ankyrin repeat domain-containing protein [Alphaproteobacteria bacterium]|nr:ankyrin repeat domain-containing protein [Alphaproteobacteria bacterium]
MTKFLTTFTAILLITQTAAAKEFNLKWWAKATPEQVEAELKSGTMDVNKAVIGATLPLKAAAEACASPEVLKVLIKNGADVNKGITEDAQGDEQLNPTPLGSAPFCSSEVMRTLIDAGAELNIDSGEFSLLMSVVSTGNDPELVSYLIEKGANYKAGISTEDGYTEMYGMDIDGNHVLMYALQNENPIAMIDALLKSGVDVNMPGYIYANDQYIPITVLDYVEQQLRENDPYIKVNPRLLKYLLSKGAKHASEL